MKEKDFLIEEEIREEVNALILEELTVSDEVLESSENIEEYIFSNIYKQSGISFTDGGTERHFSFRLSVFNNTFEINFNVTNYNFRNESYYNVYIKKHNSNVQCGSSYQQIGNKTVAVMYLNFISINFKPLSKFYEDLHHELNHLYQQYKEQSTYNDSIKYSKISTDIFSNDSIRKDAANLLYLCNPKEQDSFASSVYPYVRHKYSLLNQTLDDILKETECYQNIYKIKELFSKIENNREKYQEVILKRHGFQRWDRFEKSVRNAIHRFEHKFAMCVKKCKNDFLIYENHTWFEPKFMKDLYKLS